MPVAAKRLQLKEGLWDFSDGTSLSYRIDDEYEPKLFKNKTKRFVPLGAMHWATVMFPRATTVYLPLYTATGNLKKGLRMKAGTTVRAFFDSISAFMSSKITKADASRVTAAVPYATSASVYGLRYNQLPMDHVFYEGVGLEGKRQTISLGS